METESPSSLVIVLPEIPSGLEKSGVPVYTVDPSVRSESVCTDTPGVLDRCPEIEGDVTLLSSQLEEVLEETVGLDTSPPVAKTEVNSVKVVML